MSSSLPYLLLFSLLLLSELAYFKIARLYGIVDKPNERSSHRIPTIRGGGIVFIIAILFWFVYSSFSYPYWVLGATLVAGISLLDDFRPRLASIRILIHVVSISLLFYEISLYEWSWWLVALAVIISIGALNAFNFMDGINGITGVYALVNLGSFLFIQHYVQPFTNEALIKFSAIAILLFLFFNFQKRAVCFAGDVGAVTLAYLQIFLLLQLVFVTDNFFWVIFFLVFGVDSVVTIIIRLARKENIFKPHRTHLYQYLTNEMGISHQRVSISYGLIQLLLNAILIWSFVNDKLVLTLTASLIFLMLYLWSRFYTMKWIAR